MSVVLVDTSVLIRWFGGDGSVGTDDTRDAVMDGRTEVIVLDLAYYELANVLLRSKHWTAGDVVDQLDDLRRISGEPVRLHSDVIDRAAELSATEGLTFDDAAWAACAQVLGVELVSLDDALINRGLAVRPGGRVDRAQNPRI